MTIVYDGDGNRVAKTVGGVTTKYLVDDTNLTGYAQVLEETVGGTVQRVYTYGLNRISQSQASGASFYGYDGHGSVRLLTDATGAVTDRYDYDAFGNIVSQAGSTSSAYLYSGEQNDPNLGFYYLRSRYYNITSGRFVTADSFGGLPSDPNTEHRYTFVSADPTNKLDPSGNITLPEITTAVVIEGILTAEEAGIAYQAFSHYHATPPDQLFSGVFFSGRFNTPAFGVSGALGPDFFYDVGSNTLCVGGALDLSVAQSFIYRYSSYAPLGWTAGFYSGGNECDGPSPGLALSVNIPLRLYQLAAAPLAPKFPFRGLIQRLSNVGDRSWSVSLGYSPSDATKSQFGISNAGLSETLSLSYGGLLKVPNVDAKLSSVFGATNAALVKSFLTVSSLGTIRSLEDADQTIASILAQIH